LIDHHFWAPDQRNASLLAKSLYDRRYLVTLISPIDMPEGTKIWTVDIELTQSPTEAASASFVEAIVRFAAEFDAQYDGWGTVI
jgi:regulator of RNase E activity RraB